MIAAPLTANEEERLRELDLYAILDTLPEKEYDQLTAIAAAICGTKISLVSLIDHRRQWFKSHYGMDDQETPREYAFCAHAILQPSDVFIIPDAREDHRFHDNPLVTGKPHVIFYAGVPLITENGYPLGTLCVLDDQPRLLKKEQIDALIGLAEQTINLMELRKKKAQLEWSLRVMEMKNRQIEEFAMHAAHDLKSPLGNIMQLTDMLMYDDECALNDSAKELTGMMRHSAEKLRNLVDGLLAYTRTDNLLKSLPEKYPISILAHDIEGMIGKYEHLTIQWRSSVDEIRVQKQAFQSILLNLITNSIKYNHKPLCDIVVTFSISGSSLLVSVKDNGDGIQEDFFELVFKPFEILTNKDRFGKTGSGIGLAAVRKMIEAMGGSIRIKESTKEGTVVQFDLPLPK